MTGDNNVRIPVLGGPANGELFEDTGPFYRVGFRGDWPPEVPIDAESGLRIFLYERATIRHPMSEERLLYYVPAKRHGDLSPKDYVIQTLGLDTVLELLGIPAWKQALDLAAAEVHVDTPNFWEEVAKKLAHRVADLETEYEGLLEDL